MPDIDTVRSWEGRTMVDRDGTPVGSINAIYLDDRTGRPEWALDMARNGPVLSEAAHIEVDDSEVGRHERRRRR